MSAKVYLAGLAGGLLVTAALIYPSYMWVPYQFITDWKYASDSLAAFLGVLALLLFVATGVAAARLSGLQTRFQAAGAGAVAGLMAAMLSFMWMVRPAVGVYGAADLLARGAVPAENETVYLKLVMDSVIGIGWWTGLAYFAWLAGGILLAALGGLAAGPRGEPDKHWKLYGLPLALSGTFVAGGLLVVDAATMTLLVATTEKAAARNGTPSLFPVGSMLYFPLLADLLFLLFWQLVTWRTLRGLVSGGQVRARLWGFAGYFSVAYPLFALLWLVFLDASRWWIYLAGMGLATLAGIPSLRIAFSIRGLPVTEEYAFRGRRWVVFFAILAALFTLSTFTQLVGTSLSIVLLVISMLSAILPPDQASLSSMTVNAVDIVRQNYQAGWYATGWMILWADLVAAFYMTVIVVFVTGVIPRTRSFFDKLRSIQESGDSGPAE